MGRKVKVKKRNLVVQGLILRQGAGSGWHKSDKRKSRHSKHKKKLGEDS
jgi:hypothetical protein